MNMIRHCYQFSRRFCGLIMSHCYVPQCNHTKLRDTCKFFRFPKNPQLLKKWETLCRRKDRPPHYENSRICSCHFVDGKKDNGPSLFQWNVGKAFAFSSPQKTRMKWQAHFEVDNKCEPHTGLTVNVTRVYFHGRSVVDEEQTKDDVALLKLLRDVTSIEPAKLPLEAPSPGEVGVVIGYEARRPRALSKPRTFRDLTEGETSAQQSCRLLRKLQMVQMKSACVDMDASDNYERQFCSYNTPESFADCRFDSGGPWFHETRSGYKILVGVSTFGSFYCNPKGVNGLYTDIHAYRNWIDKVLKGNIDGYIRVVAYDNDDNDQDEYNNEGDDDDYVLLEDDDFKEKSYNRDEGDDDDNNYLEDEMNDYASDEEEDSYSDEDEYSELDENTDYETGKDDDYESDEDDHYSDDDYNDNDDNCDYDDDKYNEYTKAWVPSGSPYVVGPPFTN